MTLNEILSAVRGLTPAHLAVVAKEIKVCQSLSRAVAVRDDPVSDWVLSGMINYLIREGVIPSKGAYYDITRRNSYKVYQSKLPGLMIFLNELQQKAKLTKRSQPQVAFLCAVALAQHLRGMGIFSVSAMLSQIDRVPEALDKGFPGYVAGGLFGFVTGEIRT